MNIPKDYKPVLNVQQTQAAIKIVRDTFQYKMESELGLTRVSAPMFVSKNSGLNDSLNGFEQAVNFTMKDMPGQEIEIVHSLAKWKRMALHEYGFGVGEGLYTNMNAIRKDEDLDNLHSAYVDQWDWEKVISAEQRNYETLKHEVENIFMAIKHLEHEVSCKCPGAVNKLPDKISFVSTQELLDMYPDLPAKERENKICKERGCVFLTQIGKVLSNGEKHDNRAPDYDDWELNGDILFWFDTLKCALEISSMGIRVNGKSLKKQLAASNCEDRLEFEYHKGIVDSRLPLTIGGGIGQSRLCMLLLNKAHIGEVQSSIWPADMVKLCKENNINLL